MSAHSRILVVDDDPGICDAIREVITAEGYAVQTAPDGEAGLALVKEHGFDLIIVDLVMRGMDGMAVLRSVKADDPDAVVIVITAHGTIEAAVQAMKLGAFDFLSKPFTPDELRMAVRRGLSVRRLTLHNRLLKEELKYSIGIPSDVNPILGLSSSMVKVREQIQKVAPTNSTVLILGETGTGKELVARAIHQFSERQQEPMLTVDCGALVETLFESELFGHVKGSFTGATATKHGRFELANGGTLFLDEITNIGPKIQGKLLRAIQEREIIRVGSSHSIKVDVRIIAATNRDILQEINQGNFREDLFYRLSVVPIHLPPLRERKDDITALTDHFLDKFKRKKKKDVKGISEAAMNALMSYDWPGNVRELESVIERAAVLTENETIMPADLMFFGGQQRPDNAFPEHELVALETLEQQHIRHVLTATQGKKSKTAEILGIDRKTLRLKMAKYGIGDDSD
ncbi:MAG: sigma-54-dependent Fis family transcriptional regulator [Deltaproteobacteria bacterium]|nr:sigma-54-dependent Fis family transcriptional regulator [Candidatus Zymogenaceae bacterium]